MPAKSGDKIALTGRAALALALHAKPRSLGK
jgi:hypothetical protein